MHDPFGLNEAEAAAARGAGVADLALVGEIAHMIYAIQVNYEREGAFPGSRFAGERLEVVQAWSVIRRIQERARMKAHEPLPGKDAPMTSHGRKGDL
jgi:hypothetical protein